MLLWSILACADDSECAVPGFCEKDAHAGADPLFPLNGAHQSQPCSSCHGFAEPDGNVPRTCVGCHEDDLPPAHIEVNGCGSCHGNESWSDLREGSEA